MPYAWVATALDIGGKKAGARQALPFELMDKTSGAELAIAIPSRERLDDEDCLDWEELYDCMDRADRALCGAEPVIKAGGSEVIDDIVRLRLSLVFVDAVDDEVFRPMAEPDICSGDTGECTIDAVLEVAAETNGETETASGIGAVRGILAALEFA